MCNQNAPSVSLQTAVHMQVQEFAKNGTMFSVHDITRNIRLKVKAGDLEIPETEVSGTSFRNDIPHATVKKIFDELWQTGVFDAEFTLSRVFNRTYFEYTPTLVNQSIPVPTPPPLFSTPPHTGWAPTSPTSPTVPTVNSPWAPAAPTVPSPTVSVKPTVSHDTAKARIDVYLKNCARRNFRPTLKHVQSAIKRDYTTGWTCQEIKNIIETDLKIQVIEDDDFVSASQVAVV